jgi:hypothetical protein
MYREEIGLISYYCVYYFLQCRLVIAQMTSTRSDGFNTLLYFFVPIQIMSVYGALTERMEFGLLFLLNIFVILAHLHYAICVVNYFDNLFRKMNYIF